MTQIDSAAQLAAIIRRQVAVLRAPAATARRAGGSAPEPNRASGAQGRAASDEASDTASLIAKRVQAIDPADPHKARKAFRIFLESVLLAELGESLINDPAFYQLVEQVQQDMESDAQLAEPIQQAAALLLSSVSGGAPKA